MQPMMFAPQLFETRQTHKPHPKSKFSEEEDEKLRTLIAEHGDSDWHLIASKMETRNPRQCRERWRNYLCPEVENGPWSEEEDRMLDDIYAMYGPKWKFIATFFPRRTDINIKSRWQVHVRRVNKQLVQRRKVRRPRKPSTLPLPDLPPTTPIAETVRPDVEAQEHIWEDDEFHGFVDAGFLCPDFGPFGSETADWI